MRASLRRGHLTEKVCLPGKTEINTREKCLVVSPKAGAYLCGKTVTHMKVTSIRVIRKVKEQKY